MDLLSAIFYGIIQGITEFLPISSSGHLNILHNIFGMETAESSSLTFDILLHLATLVAVFIVYYKDIFALAAAVFSLIGKVFKGKFKLSEYTETERFVLFVLIATLPLAVVIFIKDWVELLASSTKIIGAILILNGLVLFISDKMSRGNKSIGEIKPRNALIVGLCQLCAVVPGLSRSGSTITGALTQGLSRETAVKFSFILSIPAIIGANVFSIPDILETPIPRADVFPYIAGMAAAALAGIAAMKLLSYISKKANFRFFSYYCFAIGLLAVIFG